MRNNKTEILKGAGKMDKLKEIKHKWNQDFPKTLYSEDINWLIEQVERYEKVLKEIAEDEKNCEW